MPDVPDNIANYNIKRGFEFIGRDYAIRDLYYDARSNYSPQAIIDLNEEFDSLSNTGDLLIYKGVCIATLAHKSAIGGEKASGQFQKQTIFLLTQSI